MSEALISSTNIAQLPPTSWHYVETKIGPDDPGVTIDVGDILMRGHNILRFKIYSEDLVVSLAGTGAYADIFMINADSNSWGTFYGSSGTYLLPKGHIVHDRVMIFAADYDTNGIITRLSVNDRSYSAQPRIFFTNRAGAVSGNFYVEVYSIK